MTLIQSEIRKIRLVLMVCTILGLLCFVAGVVFGILSPRLGTICFVAWIVLEGFWAYLRLRKVAAKQRAIDSSLSSDRLAYRGFGQTPNGAACYLFGILFPLTYLLSRPRERNDFLRFHCFQCLILFSTVLPLMIIRDHVPRGEYLASLLLVIWLFAWIISMIMAARQKMFHLPVIGELAEWLARR